MEKNQTNKDPMEKVPLEQETENTEQESRNTETATDKETVTKAKTGVGMAWDEKKDAMEKKRHSTLTIALLIFIAALLLSFFIAFLLSTFTHPKGKPVVTSTTSYTFDDEPNVCSSCGQVHSCGSDCTTEKSCSSCGTSDNAADSSCGSDSCQTNNTEQNANGTGTNENAEQNAK